MSEYSKAVLVGKPGKEFEQADIYFLLHECEPHFYFPYQWWPDSDGFDGKPPKDPLTIYFNADVSGGDDNLTYKITLRNLIKDTLALYLSDCLFPREGVPFSKRGLCSDEGVHIMTAIRNGLQKEIAYIDGFLKKSTLTATQEKGNT